MWTSRMLDELVAETGIGLRRDGAACADAGEDFGHLVSGAPRAVAQLRTADDVAAVLRFATQRRLSVTPRAGGYSQSGQSISRDGLTLDVSRLDRIGMPDAAAMNVECEAGARWRDVVARCLAVGTLPAVVPLNLDLTVGGILSAGGIGATSHTHGPVVGNVTEVEAATGSGILARTAPGEELFDAVLAGVGRCGVITSARIRLRRAAPYVRTFCLSYESHTPWLADQHTLATGGGCTYLEAFCSATTVGSRVTPAGRRPALVWSFVIHASFEHEAGAAPDVLPGLTGAHRLLYFDDDETARFAARYDGRFAMMHRTGGWQQVHPWLECLVPLDALDDLLPRLLDQSPPFLGDGHRLTIVAGRGPRFFMFPDRSPAVMFAVLPMGVPAGLRDDALRAVSTLHDTLAGAGGKRYLSGWFGMMDEAAWRRHFGTCYDDWMAAKQRFDPAGVLQSVAFPGAMATPR